MSPIYDIFHSAIGQVSDINLIKMTDEELRDAKWYLNEAKDTLINMLKQVKSEQANRVKASRSSTYTKDTPLFLGEMIKILKEYDPNIVVHHGYKNPHSYRGDYERVAFEPSAAMSIGAMIGTAQGALGSYLFNWHGHPYYMDDNSLVHLAKSGEADPTWQDAITENYLRSICDRHLGE